jgi:signal transduction histidine kinase
LQTIRKQLVGLVAIVAAPLVAAMLWIGWAQYQSHREILGETLLGAAHALSAAADRELATGQTLVETLALSPLVDERRFGELYALTVKALASRPGTSVVLFDPDGNQVFNTARPYGAPLPNVFEQEKRLPSPAPGQVPRGGAQYVRKAFETRKPVYSDLFEGQVTGMYLVAASVPVMREGRMLYCMTIALPSALFQPLVAREAPPLGSGALLFDGRGIVIARAQQPETFVGRPVPRSTLEAAGSFVRAENMEGQTSFRGIVRSPVSGWGAAAVASDQAAWAPAARALPQLAVAAALLLALAALVVGLFARTIRGREEERLARSVAEARQRDAEEVNRAKDRFLAALSHELRNPLGSIALAAELLEHKGGRADPAAVGIISRQVAQLRRLLDDLLDTARAVYGKLALESRRVDLRQIAAAVVADHLRRAATRAAIELSGASAWTQGDPARLYQMLDNLVDNAVKYGGRRIEVRVGAEGEWAQVSVVDDGPGIPAALLPRLFEPFVQGEQPMDRRTGGLGLGLALVRRLAILHGGTITAHSAGPNQGASFTIRLPRTEPAQGDGDVAVTQSQPGRRVIVIEDAADARESLRLLLESEGHEVQTAADGLEGLAKLASFAPDVALVDVGLPGIDGYEVARRARASSARLRLVALTGYGQEEDRRRALEAGFDLHLTKPVAYDELRAALQQGAR